MMRDYHTSPKHHGLAVSHAFHARQADPARTPHHSTAGTTPQSQMKPAAPRPQPRTHTGARHPYDRNPQQHPAHMRARARPISRARALPTNRHEGGSLT